MRVGILSQWFPPETGPASIPGVLAKGLVQRGHEVTVVTGFPNYPVGSLYDGYRMRLRQDCVTEGYRIRRVALYPDHSSSISGRLSNYGSFAASATALGTAALRGIDVLWVYNSPATVALPMWVAKARFHAPVVLHNMDMWPDSVIHTGFAPKRASVILKGLRIWVEAMYRSATTIAYISESAGEELQRRGVPTSKLRYAPVWVDEAVFRPGDGTDLRDALGYGCDDVVIGYAGALGQAQAAVQLIHAVLALPASIPIRCLILGSGTEASTVSRLAKQHPTRVQFLGQVPHKDMTAYSAVPDVSFVGVSPGGDAAFASPSKIHAIMACGKPILAAAAGDPAALIQRSGAGLVVPPGNATALSNSVAAIARMSKAELEKWGHQGLQYYRKELSMNAGIDRLERILRESL